MPLVVVPLDPQDTELLTLAEWDRLTQSRRVVFERPAHPLADRLRGSVEVQMSGEAPSPDATGVAYVPDPRSPAVVELARAGAIVTSGPASSPDSVSAARAAGIVRRAAAELATLAVVMARLRAPDGCPWDREQDHRSLSAHLVEETSEVLDAIDRGLLTSELEEELGDVLLQVFFHAQMAADDGRFDVSGVARAIVAKLVHRHPHVFGDAVVEDAGQVVARWEEIKAAEKPAGSPATSLLDGIPRSLSALSTAYKVQKRAARTGFSPEAASARAAIAAALDMTSAGGPSAASAGEAAADADAAVGEALLWTVALARSLMVDPEGALRRAVLDFAARYAPPQAV